MKNYFSITRVLVCSLLTGLTFCPIAEALEVKASTAAPVIDGKLDDKTWHTAARIDEFIVIGTDRKVHKHKAMLAVDPAWIYVGFEVAQPESSRMRLRYSNHHDDFVQREDCVKFAFSPEGSVDEWYIFKLSRGNVRQDRRITKGKHEVAWNIPWRSAVHENEHRWSAEIAIPRCLLPPFDYPEKATANFYITLRNALRDANHVITGEKSEYFTAVPQKANGSFEPQDFMPLTGLDKIDLAGAFLPLMTQCKTSDFYTKNGQYYFDIHVDLKRFTARKGKLQLAVIDDPVSGKAVLSKEVMFTSPANTLSVTLPVSAKNMAAQSKIFTVLKVNGEEWQQAAIATAEFSAYLDRNYYTTEKTAYAICNVKLPAEALKNMTMEVLNGKVSIAQGPAAERFPIDLSKLAPGKYDLVLKLRNNSGNELAAMKLSLTKRKPNPGNEYKLDHERRCILDNGKPFFMFAICLQNSSHFSREMMMRYKNLGFNTVQIFHTTITQKQVEDLIPAAAAANLRVALVPEPVTGQNTPPLLKKYGGKAESLLRLKGILCNAPLNRLPRKVKNDIYLEFYKQSWPAIRKMVDLSRKHNNILSWYILDEPVDSFDMHITGRRYQQDLQQADGYRPTMVLYSSHIPTGDQWLDWIDVLGTDPYWIPGQPHERGSINFVSQITRRTELRALKRRTPTFQALIASYWSGTIRRTITAPEQRAQTYLAAIHGTSGIIYYSASFIFAREQWQVISDLAREFEVIGPACIELPVAQNIEYTLAGKKVECIPENGKFTDIQVSLKRDPQGGYILLAANSRHYPVKAELSIKNAQAVKPLFGNNAPRVNNGTFSEEFEAYGTRAWRISGKIAEPAAIKIAMTPPAEIPPGEQACLRYRTGVKNVIQNPSFEENTIPNWPDFYRTYCQAWPNSSWIGEKDQFWGTDTTTAKFGKYSLMLKNPSTVAGHAGRVYWHGGPFSNTPQQYVFSLYAKADHNNAALWIRLPAAPYIDKRIKLSGTDWQRIEIPVVIPANLSQYCISFIELSSKGKVWLDGLQLEKGKKATEFSE